MKLHLGCGKRNFGSDWIHIDGGDYPHLDGNDILNLNFPENSVDLIYASHVLEYFDAEEVILVLKEWRRVLKPSGILRLAVPNFERMAKLYVEEGVDLYKFIGPLYGRMKMGNSFIYHKITYDFNSLKEVLEKNGFKNIQKYNWRTTEHGHIDDHSQAYIPHMEKTNGTLISLNVEGVKD